MEGFGGKFKKGLEKGARKAALFGALTATSLGAMPIKTQGETLPISDKDKIEKTTKDSKKEFPNKNLEIINEFFSQREIVPNKGEDFLKKVDYWYKQHSEGGANHQALKDGWRRLLETNKKKQSDLETIFSIFERHGVPKDLVFLALAESYWNKNAYNAGSQAGGPWQFIPDSAKRFGLKDRYNIVESTEAACKYLKWLRDLAEKCAKESGVSISESDLWSWAFLAYNRGEGYVLERPSGKQGDFFKFKGDINEYVKNCKVKESVNYPTKIMGIAKALEKMIIKNENYAKLENK